MSTNLDVKAAFDSLYLTVAALHKLTKQKKVSAKDAEAALKSLHRVDSVLQVIF